MKAFLLSEKTKAAREFANNAHEAVGQKRKYTNDPYIVHPEAVAQIVYAAGGTEAMVIAALLHDTVEDTKVTLEEIKATFGEQVADLVNALTDDSTGKGNRKARKAHDRERLAKASAEVQTIKLADLIDNTQSIVEHDKDFAKVYLEEKKLLLGVLTKGSKYLQDFARYSLANAERALK